MRVIAQAFPEFDFVKWLAKERIRAQTVRTMQIRRGMEFTHDQNQTFFRQGMCLKPFQNVKPVTPGHF